MNSLLGESPETSVFPLLECVVKRASREKERKEAKKDRERFQAKKERRYTLDVDLTCETTRPVVTGEEGLTPAITQVAVAIGDADVAVPISITLVAEPRVRRSGRG